MSVTGIIAEYNPFHNGHLYHLQETKKKLPENKIICVMSGHFLQRGEPAFLNKWSRAEMAIASGADLVLELPVLYSCRSAYWFGRGGLELLNATGLVTHFSFGVENDDLVALEEATDMLVNESDEFQEYLHQSLQKGHSYPRARALSLEKVLGKGNGGIWSQPNNVLALAYLRVVKELNLPLTPLCIKRSGSSYNEPQLNLDQYPSATAIRTLLNGFPWHQFLEGLAATEPYLPVATIGIMKREYQQGRCPVQLESLASPVLTLLRRSSREELSQLIEVTEGLESRLHEIALTSTTLADFLTKVKTKRFTYTRLQRFLIHLLLNYTKEKETALAGGPPYLRVLAFNEHGQALLKKMKANASLPIITKGGHSKSQATRDERFRCFWEMDTLATDLYSLLYPGVDTRTGGADYLLSPILLPTVSYSQTTF